MRLVIEPDATCAAATVADRIADVVRRRPDAVLGLATGRTPRPIYRELAMAQERGTVDFSAVTVFMLDEYIGLEPLSSCSFAYYARQHIGGQLRIAPERLHTLNGAAAWPAREAAAYEAAIERAGGIDLQLLGIGANGHIGFNEPPASLSGRTAVTRLSPSTRQDNAQCFGQPDAVPTQSITMGVGTILDATAIVAIACGVQKAPAVVAAASGPVTEHVPASALQRHPAATLVIDADAASMLSATQPGLSESHGSA